MPYVQNEFIFSKKNYLNLIFNFDLSLTADDDQFESYKKITILMNIYCPKFFYFNHSRAEIITLLV